MTDNLFQPFTFANGISLRNRLVMAPMTTWAANVDGSISDAELDYYRARAGGVGLVLTGCTHVQPSGIGFIDEFAAYDDSFIPSLKRLAQAARSGGSVAVLQLFHAGNKAVPELVPDGELVSASAVVAPKGPFNEGELARRALNQQEIEALIHDFGAATRRAIEAGFDGVELHGAHGFLIQNFLSPLSNQRTDKWGGTLENRMRFPLAVIREVRRVIDQYARRPFLLGYRLSPEEAGDGGLRIEDTLALAQRLVDEGHIDYLHTSLYDILAGKSLGDESGKTTAQRFIELLAGRVPLMAAGNIRTPDEARQARALGLPLVVIGKGLVMNPTWVELAQSGREHEIHPVLDLSLGAARYQMPEKLWQVIEDTPGWFPTSKGISPPQA